MSTTWDTAFQQLVQLRASSNAQAAQKLQKQMAGAIPAAINQVVQLRQQQHYEQASTLCEQILSVDRRHIDGLMLRGLLYLDLQEPESAIVAFRSASKVNTATVDTHLYLALAQQRSGHHKDAQQGYARALAKDPALQLHEGSIDQLLQYMINQPPESWSHRIPFFTSYGACCMATGALQQLADALPPLLASPQLIGAPGDDSANFRLIQLLNVLQFDKNSDSEWLETLVREIVLPWLEMAVDAGNYELALVLETHSYSHYTQAIESAQHFRQSMALFTEPLRRAGKRYAAERSLPKPPANSTTPPKIGFFVHNAVHLAHVDVMLKMLEGHHQLDAPMIRPLVYFFAGSSSTLRQNLASLQCDVIDVETESRERSYLGRLDYIRQHISRHQVDALVFMCLSTMMPFAFASRIAPTQIWWSVKYHGREFEEIDGYVTGGVGRFRDIDGRRWRASQFGGNDWFDTALSAQAKAIRRQYASYRLITGCLAREKKLDNAAYLDTVCALLKQHLDICFLWTGREQLPSIQAQFDDAGISDRCFYIGWVNTKLYAQVIDLLLDCFPLGCGYTAYEAMAAGAATVFYASTESQESGVPALVHAIDSAGEDCAEEKNQLASVYANRTRYFCADNTAHYQDMATRLIQDDALRQQSGEANRQFISLFYEDQKKMASGYARHFIELVARRETPPGT